MTTLALRSRRLLAALGVDFARIGVSDWKSLGPAVLTAFAFVTLFHGPMGNIARSWWNEPDAGHGLLLAPLAVYLAWQRGIARGAREQRVVGIAILAGAVGLRYLSGLAAELFTMRFSMVMALFGLVVFVWGVRQLRHWWLPVALVVLSIPLPAVVLGSLALPLQLKASQIGAALLEWRHVPVLLQGNVIHLPGQTLFVAEACSGLRSLTSLLALGVLVGGLWLRYPATRVLLILLTLPIAILLNGVRVFLTGFLVFFVDPKLGEGFMHLTEGWIIFVVAFAILGTVGAVLLQGEALFGRLRR